MTYDDNILHKLWGVEMEILDVIHSVCQKHGLRYSLGFGSLIGAVRHGGFIPWDDDIDIIMPRQDYEQLIKIWAASAPADYIIQHKDNSHDFTQNFVKIRKNHTTFLEDEEERSKKFHKGIFVDICPCDRVAPGRISRLVQYFFCAIDLLYSKEHPSGTQGLIGIIERILLCIPKKLRTILRRKAKSIIAHWNSNDKSSWFCSDTIPNCRRHFSCDLFINLNLVSFQGRRYFAIHNPSDFLSVRYGDYMQLPPEEYRVWKHHPIIIDFDHNYDELNR